MHQHEPITVPSTHCALCEQFATAISALLSRQPETFDLVPFELLSGQVLYERTDDIDEEPLFSGLDLASSTHCSKCTTLADNIKCKALHNVSDSMATLKASKLGLSGPMCATGCFILEINTASESYILRIVPSYFANSPNPDPSLIDLTMIRKWVQICNSQHAGQCHTFASSQKRCRVNMRIIDVVQSCIVTVPKGQHMPEYTALSYVWGRVETLLCKKSNLATLGIPGILDVPPFSHTLATTIRDAMTLTKSLGLKYLWADMLCIVQDDSSDKTVQLPNMGNIYGDAYFTIIAADGEHAQSGIPGVSTRFPRTTIPPLLHYGNSPASVKYAVKPPAEEGREKIWHTRAWTMQERALSQRTLIILDQTVSWICMQASFDEETFIPSSSDTKACYYCQVSSVSDTNYVKMTNWPHLDNYCELVSLFTERSMGFADDMLNAFSGILATLEPSFRHGFIQGLPELFFDIALLWRRFESDPNRRTRRPYRRSLKPNKQWASTRFASWSWAGWEGCRVQWPMLYNDAVDWDMEVIPITPVTSWLKVDEHGGLSTVRNEFYPCRILAQRINQPEIRDGWKLIEQQVSPLSSAEMSARFQHSDAPGMKFRYPLPMAEVNPEVPVLDLRSMHLKFKSMVCNFTFHEETLGSPFPQGSLYTKNGVWAGFMHDIQISVWAEELDPITCEVVAISTGFANIGRERLAEKFELGRVEEVVLEVKHFPQIREAGDVYHFYNVMWLAWEDGIAYRRGIGRVWKPIWEQQDMVEIEITLG